MFSGRIVCCRDALDFLTNPRFGRAVFDDLMKRRGLPMSPMSCSLTAFCYWSDASLSSTVYVRSMMTLIFLAMQQHWIMTIQKEVHSLLAISLGIRF